MGKPRRQLRVARFDLDEAPRLALAHDQEIDLPLELVAQVAQLEAPQSQIVPAVDRLEQMAGDQGFRPGTGILAARPIAQEPLRLLHQRLGHVLEPGPDEKAVVQALQQIDPALHRVDGHPDLPGQTGIDELPPRPLREQLHQQFHRAELLHPGHIAQVLPSELFMPQRPPPSGEARVAFQEGLGETAMNPQRLPVLPAHGCRRAHRGLRRRGRNALGHRPRVHAIEKIATHQAVATAFEDIEPRTPRDDEPRAVAVAVEEAFQPAFPLRVLVQLVERDHRRGRPQAVEPGGLRHPGRAGQQDAPVVGIVPIEVVIGKGAADRRLPHLPRAAHQRHLAMLGQVLPEHRFVETRAPKHGTKID